MRFIFLLFFTFSLSLFASPTFQDAIKLYKNKQYAKAFEVFDSLQFNHLNNNKFNYYFGKSAYNTEQYKDAIIAYERILIPYPNHQNAQYEIAKTYLKLHMYEDSISNFKQLLKIATLSKKRKANIHYYLKKANKGLKQNSLKASLSLGLYYDDNIKSDPSNQYIYIPSQKKNIKVITEKEDFYHQQRASLTYKNDIGDRGDWIMRHDLSVLNKSFFKEKEENKINLSYYPSFIYDAVNYTFKAQIGFIKTFEDGKDYRNYYLARTNLIFQPYHNTSLNLQAMISKKQFSQAADNTKDSNTYSLQATLAHKPLKNLSSRWRVGMLTEKKERGSRIDIDADTFFGGLYLHYRINNLISLKFNNNFRQKKYEDYSKAFLSNRKDFIWQSLASVVYSINPRWTTELQTVYRYRDSNQDLYDYEKKRIGINVYYRFDID